MPPVGFDEEGFVGCVGVGPVLVVVVKAAFGQVCDVQQVFERVLRPSVFGRFGFVLFGPLLAEGF